MDEIQALKDRVASLERQVELLMLRNGIEATPMRVSGGDIELEIIMRRCAIKCDVSEFNEYIRRKRGRVKKDSCSPAQ